MSSRSVKPTKPVGPEWELISQRIRDDFAAEGIEIVLPVIPWDDDDEEELPHQNHLSENDKIPMQNLREIYKENLDLLDTVCAHTHTERKLHLNQEFRSKLLSESNFNNHSRPIPIVNVSETPRPSFLKNHVLNNGCPAIIRGIQEAGNWRAKDRWSSLSSLMNHYGQVPVKVGEVPPIHGMGRPYQVRLPLVLFKEYSESSIADSPFYGFEFDFNDSRSALLEDYSLPEYFNQDFFDIDEISRGFYPNFRHLIVGGERTGTNLHFDPKGTSAWNSLLIGRKKWAFFPPGTDIEYIKHIGTRTCQSGTAPGGPVAYWWLDVAPNIKAESGMIECIQHPGETVFIPAGWWHCVINLEFSMAITQNVLIAESLPFCWHQIKKDWPKWSQYIETKYNKKLQELGVPGVEEGKGEFCIDDDEVQLEFHTTQMQ